MFISKGIELDVSPLLAVLEQQFPHWVAFYLFGSHARGQATADSDVDLAVLIDGPSLDPVRVWYLAEQLASMAGCNVDLVDLKSASTVMRYQIITQGICLKARQPAAHVFEARVVQDKLDLDIQRGAQMEEIQARSYVYGR